MLLRIGDEIVMVHFFHQHHLPRRFTRILHQWNHQTHVTVHRGLCVNRRRPCETPGAVIGVARCSRKDIFDRSAGRKLAFTRAMAAAEFSKAERTALWKAYFRRLAQDRRPKKAKTLRERLTQVEGALRKLYNEVLLTGTAPLEESTEAWLLRTPALIDACNEAGRLLGNTPQTIEGMTKTPEPEAR